MKFTDLFIRRPVLALVVNLVILIAGFQAIKTLNFRQYPRSENASITEYFHRLPQHPNGDNWLLVVTIVDDPKYLTQPFYTSTNFKRVPNGAIKMPGPADPARILAAELSEGALQGVSGVVRPEWDA